MLGHVKGRLYGCSLPLVNEWNIGRHPSMWYMVLNDGPYYMYGLWFGVIVSIDLEIVKRVLGHPALSAYNAYPWSCMLCNLSGYMLRPDHGRSSHSGRLGKLR